MPGSKRRLPTAPVVHCRGGGSVFGGQGILEVPANTDADWKAFDCVRVNRIGKGVRLVRTSPGRRSSHDLAKEIQPEVLVGDTSLVAPID